MQLGEQNSKASEAGQVDLFGLATERPLAQARTASADQPDWSEAIRLAGERETLGLYLTGHPINRFEADLPRFVSSRIADLVSEKPLETGRGFSAGRPSTVEVHAGLSLAWTVLGGTFLSGDEQRQAYVSARAAADRALQLDADVATAHDARGLLLQWADLDWTGAEAEYRRAAELAPADGLSKFNLGRLFATLGQPQQAIPMIRQAIAIDPRNSAAHYWLAWNLAATGRLQEAEEAARKAIELMPGKPFLPAGLAIIQIQRGEIAAALDSAQQEPPGAWRDIALAIALQVGSDRAAADAALKDLIARSADGAAYQIAEAYGLRKDPDSMFTWLDRAWDIRDSGISRLLTDPFILPYADDPRFAAFCRKVGLPAPGPAAPTGSAGAS